jgi:hypothetical protein
MPRTNKNCESVILQTKWHNSQVNNDAKKLEELGIETPDLDSCYAKAFNARERRTIFFISQQRYERWLKQQTDMSAWETTILNCQKMVI